MKRQIVHLLKVAVGVALLVFLYYRLSDPQELWHQILDADKQKLLLAGLFYAAAVFISSLKWFILLRARGVRVPFRSVIAHQWVGEFFNYALPTGVGGDLMRGYGLARDTRRTADAAVSVLIDRFLGLTTFMVCAAVASVLVLFLGSRTDGLAFTAQNRFYLRFLVVASTLGAVMLLTILGIMFSRRFKHYCEWVLSRLPLAQVTLPPWRTLATAFNAYRHQGAAMGWSVLGSLLILFLTSVTIWFIAGAIEPHSIPFPYVFTMNPIIGFALLVPITPGGAGIRQVSFVALFSLVGVDEKLSFAVGILQHAIGLLVSLPGIYLWMSGRSRPGSTAGPADEPIVALGSPSPPGD